jgi:hypothetical protein
MYGYGNRRGLGQDFTSLFPSTLPDLYSQTNTITGLPLTWEIGLAGLGAIVLWSITRRTGRAVRSRAKKHVARLARAL